MLYDFKSGYLHVDWTFSGTNRFTFKLPSSLFSCFFINSHFCISNSSSNHVVSILLNVFALLCGHRGMACTFVVHEW
jgi:hypothetical protein